MAVFCFPAVRLYRACEPRAVLLVPVVRLKRAPAPPSAVLPPEYPPSGVGLTAFGAGVCPTQNSASKISSTLAREGQAGVGSLFRTVVAFILFCLQEPFNRVSFFPE